jgi:hypothetical protein
MNECLHMPSHGTDLLKLFPDTRIDRFGLAGSDVVKMTSREIRTAAKSAGLPFTKLDPILSGLMMTGFIEQVEEDGKKRYFKSPLLREPNSKIDWTKLISETKSFIKEYWPEIADEYMERHCNEVNIIDPFTGKEIEITSTSKTASDVKIVKGDWPDIFKYEEDYMLAKGIDKDVFTEEFLLTAQGDYGKKEIEAITKWKHS